MSLPGAEEQIRRLRMLGMAIRVRMLRVMAAVGEDVADHVRMTKLSGQVLKIRTGKLIRSINSRSEETSPTLISAVVGSNLLGGTYNMVHEYGGVFNVSAHTRMMTMVFGKLVKTPRMINVRSHSIRFPPRAYLRPSVDEKMPKEEAYIQEQVNEMVLEYNAGVWP